MADAPKTPSAGDAPRFDALLADLEAVVEQLERGELPLEDALGAFEKGMGLADKAGTILDRAEARVEELVAARQAAAGDDGA